MNSALARAASSLARALAAAVQADELRDPRVDIEAH